MFAGLMKPKPLASSNSSTLSGVRMSVMTKTSAPPSCRAWAIARRIVGYLLSTPPMSKATRTGLSTSAPFFELQVNDAWAVGRHA